MKLDYRTASIVLQRADTQGTKAMRHANCCQVLFLLTVIVFPALAFAQIQVGTNTQMSVSVAGGTPSGGASDLPAFGSNGGFLAFESDATNLVDFDNNSNTDIFLRDFKANLFSIGSVNTSGLQGNGSSNHVAVSQVLPGGFYAFAFESDASNLTSIPNLSVFRNIYVRIPSLGITEIVSPGVGFTESFGDSTNPSITAIQKPNSVKLGIVFSSDSASLISSDSNAFRDIFLSEVVVPKSSTYTPSDFSTITRIPLTFTSGLEPNGTSTNPKISADGRYIVFESTATNLVSEVSPSSLVRHIYRYDTQTSQTILISKAADGTPADDDSSKPVISYNGRYVTYVTTATNIVTPPAGINLFRAIIRYDVTKDLSEQVNVSSAKVQGNGLASEVGMSANGRLIAFSDDSSNLLSTPDTNGLSDIFVKDMETEDISCVSVGPNGEEASGQSTSPVLAATSYNGLTTSVAFESRASNLTASATFSGNGDVYLNSVILSPPPLTSETELDVPPDVTVKSKKLKFTAQKFTASSLPTTAASLQVRYEFRVTLKTTSGGRSRTTRSTIIQKRNLLTVTKSKGKYTVKNRVLGINSSTGQVVVTTGFTPRQTFTVS